MFFNSLLIDKEEKPLDRLADGAGFCSIFRKICVVGDSLSAGEFESFNEKGEKTFHDFIEDYAWGSILARMAGSKAYVFARGGMTAKEYCESYAQANGFWDEEKACQCYIIALGVNDLYHFKIPVGSVEDICTEDYTRNQPTFAGYYAQIIQRYQRIQPNAKFFFVTFPKGSKDDQDEIAIAHAKLMCDFANFFPNAYVIDLREYAPPYEGELREQIYMGGHLNPAGYVFTAKMIASYIDYIIRHNARDFEKVGLIGTPFYRD